MTELGLTVTISLIGLAFAAYLARWVLARPLGEAEMAHIAAQIRRAVEGYTRRQTSVVAALAALLGGAIFLAYGLWPGGMGPVGGLELGIWLTVSVAAGASGAAAAGHVAVWVVTRAAVRVASGARRSLDLALQVGVRAGAVIGVSVCALSQLGLALLFALVFWFHDGFGPAPGPALELVPFIPMMIAGLALGASFSALLAQLGGGTFAKAADLGADVAGREAGLGDDASQNPATIADLAGDGIGDCAGRASAEFQASVVETLAAMLAASTFAVHNELGVLSFALFPLVARTFGILGVIFGVMVVRTDDREELLQPLSRGLYVTALLHLVGFAGAAKWLVGGRWLDVTACGVLGAVGALAVMSLSQFATDLRYRPVRELAESGRAGPTLSLVGGFGSALRITVLPIVVLGLMVAGSFALGARLGEGGTLFAVALATTAMAGTRAFGLALAGFGPMVDNAGGIIEMTVGRDRPDVRGRTHLLDAVGNTVRSSTHASALATAAMGALLLTGAYAAEVRRRGVELGLDPVASSLGPAHAIAALAGFSLVAWTAGHILVLVARSARRLIDEVRRQLRDRPLDGAALMAPANQAVAGRAASHSPPAVRPSGYDLSDSDEASAARRRTSAPPPLERPAPPVEGDTIDHEVCVDMAARFALRNMVLPGVVAVLAPVALGLGLRLAGSEDNPVVAADALAAFLLAATTGGVFCSMLLTLAGGAWDNAKKYIVTGAHGGRFLVDESGARTENPTYFAAMVADTTGDSLKDAAAPTVRVLIQMLPVATLVSLPFFL